MTCLHPVRKNAHDEGESQLHRTRFVNYTRFLITKMSQLNVFRNFLNERLTTSALEIFAAAEKLFAEFEEEISRSKEKSTRLQRLLDIVTHPEIKLHRTGSIKTYRLL